MQQSKTCTREAVQAALNIEADYQWTSFHQVHLNPTTRQPYTELDNQFMRRKTESQFPYAHSTRQFTNHRQVNRYLKAWRQRVSSKSSLSEICFELVRYTDGEVRAVMISDARIDVFVGRSTVDNTPPKSAQSQASGSTPHTTPPMPSPWSAK